MQTVRLDERLYRTAGENGVTLLSEVLPGVRSVAVGVWIRASSAHEAPTKMGVSHLLEHMVFKGTERRTARDIALELEGRGGALDAYTAREYTSFQARVLDEDLPRALDVLTDVVRHPSLRQNDLELERKVVLEEISTVEDTPDDLVFELHARALWPHHPYGYSILGTRDTVHRMSAKDLQELHNRSYHPRHVVITAAGNVNHDLLLNFVAKCGWFTYEDGPPPPQVAPVPPAGRGLQKVQRETAQTHLVFGTDTFAYRDPRREPLLLLNAVLGGGMSSRLFQRVREELGLAYSVYAHQSFYQETGVSGVYVGTRPSSAQQAVDVVLTELQTLAAQGLSLDEQAAAKQQLKGQVTLGLESPTARMYRLATIELYCEPYRTIDRLLADIDAVDADQVASVAQEFFDPDRHAIVWLGPN